LTVTSLPLSHWDRELSHWDRGAPAAADAFRSTEVSFQQVSHELHISVGPVDRGVGAAVFRLLPGGEGSLGGTERDSTVRSADHGIGFGDIILETAGAGIENVNG
jgi:hypothetical protein